MLRNIRICAALLCWVLITLLFLDFTGTVHAWFGWLAKIQFLPAVLACNFVVVIALVALTLVLGRVYCSVICPLGVLQDMFAWIGRRGKKNRNKYSYSPAKQWLRTAVLALFVLLMVIGFTFVASLVAPYSAYGRIASNLFAPVYAWCNNVLAYIAERADSYAFYETEVWIKSMPVFIVAVATFLILFVLAWRGGRTYCNTICPVGTILGVVAKYSWLKPVIDTTKCNGCTLCERRCKASCINAKAHTIDYSSCVACMDCISNCRQGAISYKHPQKVAVEAESQHAAARRGFLSLLGIMAASAASAAEEKTVDGGLAVILDKKAPARKTPIVPPGAVSLNHLTQHCTACQLCVSVCPNGVLRPSVSAERFMQPESSYERGYCRPECTKCSEVCPTHAISRIDTAQKSAVQIGHAVWVRDNCVPLTDGVECGNCARHCPTGAITMVLDGGNENAPRIPVVNTEKCIGCGACENLCPARPFSAIYVEGHLQHREI